MEFSAALTRAGSVHTWGADGYMVVSVPAEVAKRKVWKLATGFWEILACMEDTSAILWGAEKRQFPSLTSLAPTERVESIATGAFAQLVLTNLGKIHSWDRSIPSSIKNETFKAIAVARHYALLLTVEGRIVMWSCSESEVDYELPALIANTKFSAVDCMCDYNLALTEDGRVLTWDYADYGDGFRVDPKPLWSDENASIRKISMGHGDALALTKKGRLLTSVPPAREEDQIPDILKEPNVRVVTMSGGLAHFIALVEIAELPEDEELAEL